MKRLFLRSFIRIIINEAHELGAELRLQITFSNTILRFINTCKQMPHHRYTYHTIIYHCLLRRNTVS